MSIQSICSRVVEQIHKIVSKVRNIPLSYNNQKIFFTKQIDILRYKLRNLRQVNIDLGMYHMKMGNFNDAILRFKLIDKFLSPSDPTVLYLLGWCYFYKKNYVQSLSNLLLAKEMDTIGFASFLQSYASVDTIPSGVWQKYRELNVQAENKKWESKNLNIPRLFVKELCNSVEQLPERCQILDLGTSIGFVGSEMNQILSQNYYLTGVEDVEWMTNSDAFLKHDKSIYNLMHKQTIQEFLNTDTQQYDIITSLCSFGFSKNLHQYFVQIHRLLKLSGYLAVLLPTAHATKLNIDICSFEYNRSDVEEQLKLAGFEIVSINEWTLNKLSTYTMFIARKQN